MMQQPHSADNPQPSAMDLAWLAGFVDGEGSFGLNVQFRKGRNRLQVAPRFTLVNTSTRTIEHVHQILELLKVGHLVSDRKRANKKHRDILAIEIIGYKRMAAFLPHILSFLVTKKVHAELMMSFVQYRLNKWQQPNGGRRAGYDGIELEVHKALKALNHSEGSETIDVASRLVERMR